MYVIDPRQSLCPLRFLDVHPSFLLLTFYDICSFPELPWSTTTLPFFFFVNSIFTSRIFCSSYIHLMLGTIGLSPFFSYPNFHLTFSFDTFQESVTHHVLFLSSPSSASLLKKKAWFFYLFFYCEYFFFVTVLFFLL